MEVKKLTSIKLQTMLNMKDFDTDLWCPVLRFGRKKDSKFSFPIIFKDYEKAGNLYDELEKLKGKTIDQVKAESESLYDKYKKYHYKDKQETVRVEIIAPKKISATEAREIGTTKKALPLSASSKFPKAMEKMTRMKRLIGSKWDAIVEGKGYVAVKFIGS